MTAIKAKTDTLVTFNTRTCWFIRDNNYVIKRINVIKSCFVTQHSVTKSSYCDVSLESIY